jgi:hypothetical protein
MMNALTIKHCAATILTCSILAGCLDAPDAAPADEATGTTEQLISCSGNGCNGVDPNTTPCASDAVSVAGATRNIFRNGTSILIGQVELRWSASCGTNWARVSRTDGAIGDGMYGTIRRSDGVSYTDFHSGSSSMWSRMVYAPTVCAAATGLVDESFISGEATTPCL